MKISAVHIGDGITLKAIASNYRTEIAIRSPLVLAHANKHIVLFPFGVVVFWDCTEQQQHDFTEAIQEHILNRYTTPIKEEETIQIGETYAFSDHVLTVPQIELKTIAVISLVLARSVALDLQEDRIQALMEKFTPFQERSNAKQNFKMSSKQLLAMLKDIMDVRQTMSLSMSMIDTPDIVWDDSVLANYYKQLLAEYEVELRYQQTNKKLELLMQHSEFILHVIENRKTHLLEITIIILIVIEIALFVYEIWIA